MTATYYLTLTDHGAQRVAAAHGQAAIVLVNLVLGDAGGQPYDPVSKKTRTNLVNQRAVVPVQSVSQLNDIARVVATIDSSIGGFNIHEIGLTDSTGQLVYIGNYHGGYKPVLAQGASGELVILIDIKADAGSQILIQISPNIVTANKQWVLDSFVLLSTFNAHVTQNQLEHNNLAALIAAEAQARGNADNAEAQARSQADAELEADTYALSVAIENALQQERNVRAADISTVATRVEDLSVFKHVRLLYRDMALASTPKPANAVGVIGDYTVDQVSAYLMPDSYIEQTIMFRTSQRDQWLSIYIPVALHKVLFVSGQCQSLGDSSNAIDDVTVRIKSFYYPQYTQNGNTYQATSLELMVDRVSGIDQSPYAGELTVYLKVIGLSYLRPTSLDNYPLYQIV